MKLFIEIGLLVYLSLFCSLGVLGQYPDRKVFSNGGGEGNVGLNYFAYTLGEPMIGTDFSSTPILTKGFHQHRHFNVLSADQPGLAVVQVGDDALLTWELSSNSFVSSFTVQRQHSQGEFLDIGQKKPPFPIPMKSLLNSQIRR